MKNYENTVDELLDKLDYAWTIIANVSGGDWEKQDSAWQAAAKKWSDEFQQILNKNKEKK